MIEETEFSIHKFDTKIFESIFDIQNNKVLHTNKDGDIVITILKYSLNTSEIKAYTSYKTEFNIALHNNPKFLYIDVFGDNNLLIKENTEIIMIEKDDNYMIYEVFLASDKKSEILFELAKKALNKVFGYNKVYIGNKEKYNFLFFEVNYNFMVYESNSKCIEINDKKIHLYSLSYFENTLFLSILYENNLLEIYQYSHEISQTASMSKFKKIIELVSNRLF